MLIPEHRPTAIGAVAEAPVPRAAKAPQPQKRTGAQILWDVLEKEGVEVVFGYPGGAIMPAYDALYHVKMKHVLVRHEQGASHMADGYARASGKVGVCLATSGPGATNLVTGIATAMMDSVPMVCITGQIVSHLLGSDGFQETDITGVTLPITKHNYLVTKPEEVGPVLREAFFIARSGRPGPVLVDITKDAQTGTAEFVWDDRPMRLPGYRPRNAPRPEDVERALELIHTSERPVVLAGHGIVKSGAADLLRQFAERANIPVATTLLGHGTMPHDHALNLGLMGMHGEAYVNTSIQEADLLIALGMRFDDRVTGNLKTYALKAKKIHAEVDASEVNKNVKADVALIGDVRRTLEELVPRLQRKERSPWTARIRDLKSESALRDIQSHPHNGRLYAAHAIHDLWRLSGGDAVIVTDVGQHQMWAAQYYRHNRPQRLITSGGLGTMGFGLPAAIGARFALPNDEIWVICGDGGFQMTAAELSTCKQEGIKVNVAIINNGYLGMVRQWQEMFFGGRYSYTPLLSPDFVKLAEAHGLTGIRVERREELPAAYERARKDPGTVVLDIRVDQEENVYPMVPSGADLDKMIRRPNPIPPEEI
ncbi:MAG TPA: biosynthetic-type acetolactate synthase large subunit [Myxococcaceae bacterium]|nr:biosynthetic-type acetolactate synthase large subunit [Myxococcaceae bacterium]